MRNRRNDKANSRASDGLSNDHISSRAQMSVIESLDRVLLDIWAVIVALVAVALLSAYLAVVVMFFAYLIVKRAILRERVTFRVLK